MNKIVMPEHYRPEIGETLFVSLYDNRPVLVTITGYRNHERLSCEVFDHIKVAKNKADYSILKEARFHKGIPTDSKYLYIPVISESEFMSKTEEQELGYFFDPDSAFNYIEAVKSGEIKPRFNITSEFAEYRVCIEKI